VLVEEPENHLSFASLNGLVAKIADKCKGKQVIATTHSSYVLNKLGLNNLVLLSPQQAVRITELPNETQEYFKRLPGYDTLVVQRAYRDRHGHLPIEDGVDVLSVRGLSAKRFLDLAIPLRKPVAVVTDNDGNQARARARFSDYVHHTFITVLVGNDAGGKTLEPQLLYANGRERLNEVLGTSFSTDDELLHYMNDKNNKAACALAIFESDTAITMPEYIIDAIG
jgi:putative ATP-dependent endonuclease of OLD family